VIQRRDLSTRMSCYTLLPTIGESVSHPLPPPRPAVPRSLTRPHYRTQWREVLDNFCTVFVSFVSRLNFKTRVSRILATVRVFCLLKTASKYTQTYHYADKKCFFLGMGSAPSTTPHPIDAYGASPTPFLKS